MEEKKNTSLAVCGKPCLFILTMDSQIIFSSTVEADTWKICFHTAPKAGEPHPKPKLASPCTTSSRVGESEQCVPFVNPPPTHAFLSFTVCPPSQSIITSFSLERYFPLFTKDWKDYLSFLGMGRWRGCATGLLEAFLTMIIFLSRNSWHLLRWSPTGIWTIVPDSG